MSRVILEVIVQSVADAREAARGGADRLEIVREISIGGLTPPLSLVRAITGETSLPLRVMVRENAGFGATASELSSMRDAAAALAGIGVDGLVVGFATGSGLPALDDLHWSCRRRQTPARRSIVPSTHSLIRSRRSIRFVEFHKSIASSRAGVTERTRDVARGFEPTPTAPTAA